MLHLIYTQGTLLLTAKRSGVGPQGPQVSRCPVWVWCPRQERTCGCLCADRDCDEAAGPQWCEAAQGRPGTSGQVSMDSRCGHRSSENPTV